MYGLIEKLFGSKKSRKPREEESEEPRVYEGEYFVPEILNLGGFYAVQISQAEMYDLGNVEFIPHFILYDRKEKIAVDVTSDVKPAPLLSATSPAQIQSEEGTDSIEKYLTGEIKPEVVEYGPGKSFGVNRFVAKELTGNDYSPLRTRMIELRDAKRALDSATNAFREQASNLRMKYLGAIKENAE